MSSSTKKNKIIDGNLVPLDTTKFPFAKGNWTNAYSDNTNVYYVFSGLGTANITFNARCYVSYLLVGGGQAGGWAGRAGWTDSAENGQGWHSWIYNGSYGNCGEIKTDYIDVNADTTINIKVGNGGKPIPYSTKHNDKSYGAGLVTLSCHDIYNFIQHGPLDSENAAVLNLLDQKFNTEDQTGGKGEDTILSSSNFTDKIVAKGGEGNGLNLSELQYTIRWIYNTIAEFNENNPTSITAPAYTDFQNNLMNNKNYGFGGNGGESSFDRTCNSKYNQPLAKCNMNFYGNNNNEYLKVNITDNGVAGENGIAILWVNIEDFLNSLINQIENLINKFYNNEMPAIAANYESAFVDEQIQEKDFNSKQHSYDNLQAQLKLLLDRKQYLEYRKKNYVELENQYNSTIATDETIIVENTNTLNNDKRINKMKKENLFKMINAENLKLQMYYNDLTEKLVGYDRKNDFESENAEFYKKVYFYVFYLYYIVVVVFFFFLASKTNIDIKWKILVLIICLLYPLFIYRIQYSIYDNLVYLKSIVFATPYKPAKKLDYNAIEAYEAYLYLKSFFTIFTVDNQPPSLQDNY
jgi:hypothetical protein